MSQFFGGNIYCYRELGLSYKKIKFLMSAIPNRRCNVPDFLFINSVWYNLKKGTHKFLQKIVVPEIF